MYLKTIYLLSLPNDLLKKIYLMVCENAIKIIQNYRMYKVNLLKKISNRFSRLYIVRNVYGNGWLHNVMMVDWYIPPIGKSQISDEGEYFSVPMLLYLCLKTLNGRESNFREWRLFFRGIEKGFNLFDNLYGNLLINKDNFKFYHQSQKLFNDLKIKLKLRNNESLAYCSYS